jgi:uncharacterized protein YpmB
MNTKFLKTATISIPAVLLFILSGCLKTHDGFVDFSKTSDFVILANSGLANLKSANIQVNADTIRKTITVDLASKNNGNGAITVTLGVDAAKIASYNASNGTSYQALPANAYKLVSTQVTVPAGQHYGTTTLEVYKSKLDPTVSYMLPVSITDGGGKTLSSNQNTLYFNVIGNPIAGNYEIYFSRWLAPDSTGGAATANYYNDDNGTVVFAPTSPTEIQTDGLFGDQVIIDFTNTNGVLSNFKASFPPGTAAAVGVASWGPPVVEVADPVNGYYKIYFQYVNSVGTRTVVYQYVRQ